jgi:hypothetical protein
LQAATRRKRAAVGLTTDDRASDGGRRIAAFAGTAMSIRVATYAGGTPERGSMDLPGPISVGIWIGVALGAWVALTLIWPRARPPRNR